MRCPIFINCRDRVTSLAALVEWLEGICQDEIYLVDNDSAYPPLLEYYEKTPHNVVRLGNNVGHKAMWLTDLLDRRGKPPDFYVYSDPDIVPITECPPDALDVFRETLERFPIAEKVGFGLKIDDLPDSYRFKSEVIRWERQFLQNRLAPGLYWAPIDTTFALYRGSSGHELGKAIRTGYPYLARHTAWYLDSDNLPEEERYYRERARRDITHWNAESLPQYLVEKLDELPAADDSNADVEYAAEILTQAWSGEPPLRDEVMFTPWAEAGWQSWNGMSPELEFCEFAALLVRLLAPRTVIETGVGQGFVTRRVAGVLGEGQRLIGFESDPAVRRALAGLPLFGQPGKEIAGSPRPDDGDFSAAQVSILDSDFPERAAELQSWWAGAPEGSVVLVHDCGNGHPPETGHAQLAALIDKLGLPGVFLKNPRGAFLGFKPRSPGDDSRLLEQMRALEQELALVKSSRSYRYTEPARRVRQLIGRLPLRLRRLGSPPR